METFHFLRPVWLLVLPAALLLAWIVARREDVRSRWRGIIAPHLLDHLVVDPRTRWHIRPVYGTVVAIIIGAIAAAGPTWRHERPPFAEDKAPLAIAIDISQTMDAIDVNPSRLERAKLKVHDLLALRPGARTALYVYSGTPHLVLPLTDDAKLLGTYLDALATNLLPPITNEATKDTAKALDLVEQGLAHEETPGTILFITDGVEPAAFSFLEDASGARVFTHLDVDALRRLGRTGVEVATVTADDADVQWVQRNVQTHLIQGQAEAATRWEDEGWWLVPLVALMAALWFRRGWTVRWVSVLVLAVMLGTNPDETLAADLLSPWLSPDQQGRLYFERGDYAEAAQVFADPMWKGVALYREGKYAPAIEAFARADSSESWFDQGNALAHLGKYPQAVKSYQQALKAHPDWEEAKRNLALVKKLIPPKQDEDYGEAPDLPADQIKFDDLGKKGKRGEVKLNPAQTAEMWMRNIQTSPAQMLQRRFALENQQREAK